ncbi:MAG: cyclopropane-fatty-acyl-phospholipid synthase family protein [Leptospiraceae bacterium]|nr:cyclopropane-fatty-acyl-phospholipid synthase family protein [Leptospiraceae bacterium]MDW8306968.1 cyclopropane-fatty-acyl-phospholipid synthase family protein [Leptospiraceae bacterium]
MWYETLVGTGFVPDFVLRLAIRHLNKLRLKSEMLPNLEKQQQKLSEFIEFLKGSPIAVMPEKANEQHYELPSEFFELVLGKNKKYSCCYFEKDNTSLDEAEDKMLELYVERAELKDGQKILELGCGWGSLTLYLAHRFPHAKILALSNSRTQRQYIEEKLKEKNLSNIRVLTVDMNDFQTKEKFDRVISIEMFEHMRNYEELLRRISLWLKPEGKLFVHIFTHRYLAYLFEDKEASDFMARYFFSGGLMPSDHLLFYFNRHMRITKHWQVDGWHYHLTAEAWLKNLDRNKPRILALFKNIYGAKSKMWFHFWRVFFMAVSELFATNRGREWLVSHYLFEKAKG